MSGYSVDNVRNDHVAASMLGRVAGGRAGPAGLTTVTDLTTELDDVDTLQVLGGTVVGDETAQVSYQSILVYLTNQSGGDLPRGSVVILDTGNDESFTTTTTEQATLKVGVLYDDIADGVRGPVIVGGYVTHLLVTASVTRGDYLETSTTAGQATANGTRRAGSFGQLLTGGTDPSAILFESPDGALPKLDDLLPPDDNTDLDATTSAHGLLDKLPGGTTTFKRADGAWAIPSGLGASDSYWDFDVQKGSDQSVTNSSTLVDDTTLQKSMVGSELWHFEAIIVYRSDGTGDFKCDFAVSTGTFSVIATRYFGTDTTLNSGLQGTTRDSGTADSTDIQAGGGSTALERIVYIEGFVRPGSTSTFKFRFAQNTTTAGQSAVCAAGSRIRFKRLV